MLKINPAFIQHINQASDLASLFPMLQAAIELEHATIPPYLTAIFSLRPNTEPMTARIIHSVVIEEMLHLTIAANILNALGGAPVINKKGFVPDYPSPLPMGIGQGLVVGLVKYSKDLVHDVFMEIEEPEHPLDIRIATATAPAYNTIGEFYAALQKKINELAPDTLPGDPSRQVLSDFYPDEQLFPILKKADALKAITIIVEQGEGTKMSPADAGKEIAHYYKFEELYKGRTLVTDAGAPYGYSFSGPPITFNPDNVFPLFPNTKAAMIPSGTEERRKMDVFNDMYGTLLSGLHQTFNGDPQSLSNTIGIMFDLKLAAEKLCATPFPGKAGFNLGPGFEQ